MVRFKKQRDPEATFTIGGHRIEKLTREQKIDIFYDVLRSTTFKATPTDITLDGVAIIVHRFKDLMKKYDTSIEENLPWTSDIEPLTSRILKRRSQDAWMSHRRGSHHISLITTELGVRTELSLTEKCQRISADALFLDFGHAKDATQQFSFRNYCRLIFWDKFAGTGYFIQNPNPIKAPENLPDVVPTYILCAHKNAFSLPSVVKTFSDALKIDFWSKPGYFEIFKHPTIGCRLDPKKCQLIWGAIMSQTFAAFRKEFLECFSGILDHNPIWHTTLETTASLRTSTLKGYISTISMFSNYISLNTRQVFQQIADQTLCPKLLGQWLRSRAECLEVEIDTVIQDISAINWFSKKLARKTFKELWPGLKDQIYSLKKRLSNNVADADAMTWDQLKAVWEEMLNYNWDTWDPQDVRDCATISTWACLRISESMSLSHETTYMSQEDEHHCPMLQIDIPDAKTSTGSRIQYKKCSHFEDFPQYCGVLAWERLKSKTSAGKLLLDDQNQPWTTDQMHTKFRKFILHCKDIKILPKNKKFSWHSWRITFLNIAVTNLQIPLYLCASVASHTSLASTSHYVQRTESDRKRKAASLVADQAQKFISQHSRKKPRIMNQTSDLNSVSTKSDLDTTFDAILDIHRMHSQRRYISDSEI